MRDSMSATAVAVPTQTHIHGAYVCMYAEIVCIPTLPSAVTASRVHCRIYLRQAVDLPESRITQYIYVKVVILFHINYGWAVNIQKLFFIITVHSLLIYCIVICTVLCIKNGFAFSITARCCLYFCKKYPKINSQIGNSLNTR